MSFFKKNAMGLLAGASLLFASSTMAVAGNDEGIPITIEVRDLATNEIIPTAVIRHPKEAARHRVNSETGQWSESVLYMSDGSELMFQKGTTLSFEISAPGFKNAEKNILVRKRRNFHVALLEKMQLSLDDEFENEPAINFDRDVPLDK